MKTKITLLLILGVYSAIGQVKAVEEYYIVHPNFTKGEIKEVKVSITDLEIEGSDTLEILSYYKYKIEVVEKTEAWYILKISFGDFDLRSLNPKVESKLNWIDHNPKSLQPVELKLSKCGEF